MTYDEAIDYLYRTAPMFQQVGAQGYKAGIEGMEALDELLGHPHRSFQSVHVGGTNGKGSVSHMIASVLQAAGKKVGLYTSPHLKDFRERIQVNGIPIPQEDVVQFIRKMQPDIERIKPSFFEITTAMAFDFFRQQGVDWAVVEVGLGGRLDSTNVIRPEVSVITNVSLDHTQFLGTTKAQIAAEKAGIIKAGVLAVVGETDPESAPVFQQRAWEVGAPLCWFADQRYQDQDAEHFGRWFMVRELQSGAQHDWELGMEGDYQGRNLCTALAVLDLLALPLGISERDIRTGLAAARVPGRWQTISREPCPTIVDTGHNQAGIEFVAAQLRRQEYKKLYFVLGMVGDKDVMGILGLLPPEAYYLFTQARIPRALPAQELATMAREVGLRGQVAEDVAGGLARARALAGAEDLIFVGGSTFTVAEVL